VYDYIWLGCGDVCIVLYSGQAYPGTRGYGWDSRSIYMSFERLIQFWAKWFIELVLVMGDLGLLGKYLDRGLPRI
jgi:hypothetical protein